MEEDIKRRLYNVIPSSTIHMVEFLRLMDIRYSAEIDSAAITCGARPILLLNKDFVEAYCKTDEHLFMLVMHELYHIILGHTKLFRSHTMIDNIAYDAIINAILCRNFSDPEYVSFFESINSDSLFPSCILRPVGKNTDSKYHQLLKNLYKSNKTTYYEVYESIIENFSECELSNYFLIGYHKEDADINNPLLKKMVEDIISKWPREIIITGRDQGGTKQEKEIILERIQKHNERKLLKLLKKSSVLDGNEHTNKKRIGNEYEFGESFIPYYKDRTIYAKKEIYKNVLIYRNEYTRINPINNTFKAFIYLDVSGSVMESVSKMFSLLKKPLKEKRCKIFSFSTQVYEVSYIDFKKRKFNSTGGTDIDCIFKHYFSLDKKRKPKKILILTDGYTGTPSDYYKKLIKDNSIEIYVGYFGIYNDIDLKEITKYKEEFN